MNRTVSTAEIQAVEAKSLRVYVWVMLGVAILGFLAYAVTSVSATQLDRVIALTDAGAAFVAIHLARTSAARPTAEAPYGQLALENLYLMFRSLLILGVIIVGITINLTKVIEYLITRQGEQPEFGLAAAYTGVVAIIGFALMWNHRRSNQAIGNASSVLVLESQAAKMSSLISVGIGVSLAFVAIVPSGTPLTSSTFDIRDIADSLIVLILCAMLIWEPLRNVRREFARLAGKRSDPDLDDKVREVIDNISRCHGHVLDCTLTLIDVFTIRRGKTSDIDIRVSYSGQLPVSELDAIRAHTLSELQAVLGGLRLTVIFAQRPIHDPPEITESAEALRDWISV